jgi:repressor of nif and glnA expression
MPPLAELSTSASAPGAETTPLDGETVDGLSSRPVPAGTDLRELLHTHADRYEPILGALRDQPWKELVTSRDLLETLSSQGLEWSERTLRLYLLELTDLGLIERHGRRGYRLAAAGAEVARELTISRRVSSILARMEETLCHVGGPDGLDLRRGSGLVSVNGYIIPDRMAAHLAEELEAVFQAGLGVGPRVLVAAPGEDILGREVPAGHVGLGTLCSLSIAGLLLRRGVPSTPVFGALLRLAGGQPTHVVEMIRYEGTSLSPNELFIRANLTSVGRAARTGNGCITASFREVPMGALPVVKQIDDECRAAGFQGILHIGRPGQPVLNVPVHEGRVGLLLATGLNPLAGLWERDHGTLLGGDGGFSALDASRPMVGPTRYEDLIPVAAFRRRALPAPVQQPPPGSAGAQPAA